MSYTVLEVGRSLFRLLRFIFWYALGLAVVLYALPQVALLLQAEYESLGIAVRISVLAASGTLIAAGLIKAFRLRNLSEPVARRSPHRQS